jgi:hypothetical protein
MAKEGESPPSQFGGFSSSQQAFGAVIISRAVHSPSLPTPPSVESAWTMCKLSASLCFLDSFDDPLAALVAGVRRILCYPYLRAWSMAQLGAATWLDTNFLARSFCLFEVDPLSF